MRKGQRDYRSEPLEAGYDCAGKIPAQSESIGGSGPFHRGVSDTGERSALLLLQRAPVLSAVVFCRRIKQALPVTEEPVCLCAYVFNLSVREGRD